MLVDTNEAWARRTEAMINDEGGTAQVAVADATSPDDCRKIVETSGPPEREAGGILSIDLLALVANWRELCTRAAGAECAAVVKADGYGCGIAPVSAALARAGCGTFFVADLAEARSVRRIARTATGQAASQLILERIVREARRNLVYTNLPVSTIAYALGFEDPAYFSRVYAAATGVSPRAFRTQLHGDEG